MALKSLKQLSSKPAAEAAGEVTPKKTLKSLKSLSKPAAEEPVEEEEDATPAPKKTLLSKSVRGEDSPTPTPGLKKLKPLGKKPVVAEEPGEEEEAEAEAEVAETDDLAVDRAALKAIIKAEGHPITVNKGMSDDDIRELIIGHRANAAGAEEPAEEEPEAEEPAPEPAPKKGLKKLGGKRATAAPEPEEEEVAAESREIVTVPAPVYALGQVTGEVDEDDVSRPRLEFVQSKGPLFEELEYTPGQVVLAKELLIWEKDCDPLNIIVLAATKRFVEDTEFGGDVMPRIFNTAADVRAAGLWTEWQDNEAPPVYKELVCLVLVKQPENIEPSEIFNLDIGGDKWAMAEMKLKGWNYRDGKAGKYLMTIAKSVLAKGLHHGVLNLTTVREKKTKNVLTIAVFKMARKTTPEELSAITQLMNGESDD